MRIAAMATMPDGPWAAMISTDGEVRAWQYATAPAFFVEGSVRIAPRQPMAAALSESRVLTVLSVTGDYFSLDEGVLGGELSHTEIVRHMGPVRAVALAPSGSIALIACADGTLHGVDTRTWESVWTLSTQDDLAAAVALASDAGPIVATLADGIVRRYDLTGEFWDITGPGPPVHAVAVTPDGAAIVAAGADGTLLRSDRRAQGPLNVWRIAVPITAVAVGGHGDRVLAAGDDGKVRMYDFGAGQSISFDAAEHRPPLSDRGAGQVASDPAAPKTGGVLAVDDDVRFTVYRPKSLTPDAWSALLVFAHKTGLIEEPGRPPVDPNKEVAERARARFGDTAAPAAGADARYEVARGAQLRIVPELPGILCNPREATVDWWEPIHQVEFRISAPHDVAGSVVRGPVRIWCGPLILGEVFLAIPVTTGEHVTEESSVAESAPRYHKIFPSYAHQDSAVLASFAEAARAIGDSYLRDVLALRSGERWEPRLLELIEEADIFQLFWSSNSMRSRYCRNEWEHALSLERPSFVRPVYWERPLPQDTALELPPAGLRALHFVRVQTYMALPSAPQWATEAPAAYTPDARQELAYAPPQWSSSSGAGRAPQPPGRRRGGRARTVAVLVLALVVIAVLIAVYASR
jgi:hypothetical protein